jgi:tRNA(adenine34) deaminase
MKNPDNTGHQLFMRDALKEASMALDQKEFPVGCVLVRQDHIIARGRRTNSRGQGLLELEHAEIAALRSLDDTGKHMPMNEVIAYTTMEPCLMCFATLLLNGIRHFVYAYEDVMGGGTNLPLDRLSPLYRDMSVTIEAGVLRSHSLEMVKRFFSQPDNAYWQESLLARYTLEQA